MALQFLYLMDVAQLSQEDVKKALFDSKALPERIRTFTEYLALGTAADRTALDVLITKYAENWEIRRMTAVDRNILRLAAFELLHELDTPVSVIIDEAVEIAKTFSTADSGKFVNGILDKVKLERVDSTSVIGASLPPSVGEGQDEGKTKSRKAPPPSSSPTEGGGD